jgi:hypothetical protein
MELPDTGDLAGLDLERSAEETNGALVLVCGHGSRDSCCALRGTAVYDRLAGRLGEEELWISSHHGGHRFAANVLVLPAGIHLGHVEPGEAGEIVASALAGRIELDRYRGRTCYPPPVQAAEHAIRAAHGLTEVSELRLEAFEGSLVSFRDTSGERYAARVREEEGPSVPASCGEPPKPQQTFSVHLV